MRLLGRSEMRLKRKSKNIIAAFVLWGAIMTVHPAQAFVWPVIDFGQIVSFVHSLSNGMSQLSAANSQIKNYTATIHSIGDQISAAAKYVADMQRSIAKIEANVNRITINLKRTDKDMKTITDEVQSKIRESEQEKANITESTEENVNQSIEDGETKEEVQETINAARDEVQSQDAKARETLNQAEKTIKDLRDNSVKTIDALIDTVLKDGNLSVEDQRELKQQGEDLKKQMTSLYNKAEALIQSMRENYDANSEKVLEAYTAYNQAINDYYDGKITKAALETQGKNFKEAVNTAKTIDNTAVIDNLIKEAGKISEAVDALKDNIMEKIKGTGEYDDSNNQVRKKPKYAFNFHQENTSFFLKGCYASKNATKSCGLFSYKGGKSKFLLSRELTAKGTSTAKGSGNCLNLPNSIKEIEKKPSEFVNDLRECVVRAKTESLYFCSDARDEEELAQCKPFDMEPNFKKKYRNNGIYMHIWQDYSIANISNANQIKQYAMTWLDVEKKEKSTLYKLNDAFGNMDNTRNGYSFLQQFDIEMLRLWSELRRVDAVYRAKNAVDFYRQQLTLYLDGRDDDFKAAEGAKQGLLVNKDPDCGGEEDCKIEDKNIISNGILYMCKPGLKATDISVYHRNKGDSGKVEEAEKKIKECFYKYAEGATKGTIDGGDEGGKTPDEIKKEWRKKETKALTDSLFHTLVLSTMNLYKSAKDYAKLDSEEINIASLAEEKSGSGDSRGDYSVGAKMNYYGTMQLLSIIDADAQSLQSEIIRDLSKISYNFFEKKEGEGEN